MQRIRNLVNRATYSKIIKPILFRFDAEKVHESFVKVGEFLGRGKIRRSMVSKIFNYKNKKLEQEYFGIKFRNPILLSAGFDYDARLTNIVGEIGFGGATIGSVTYGYYGGNERPRLGRLPKSKSLLVNKGLKSLGARKIIDNLAGNKFGIPIGISIAKTNCIETCEEKRGIEDYIKNIKIWEESGIGSYYELNVSCPNAFGGEPFTSPDRLERLLEKIDKLKLKKPLFLKMPLDTGLSETDRLCKVAKKHNVQGLIFGNLTKKRENKYFDRKEIKNAGKGSFSGMPCRDLSDSLIKFCYEKYGKRFLIIGAGGVFSAEDAYRKIKLGASLIEMITGMVFNGPGVVGEINFGVANLLEKEGYQNVREAVGKGY